MINIYYIYQLFIHWFADFVLQTDEQAKKKSTSITMLTYHVLVYTLVWAVASYFYFHDVGKCLIFAGITGICHWITDFVTSRVQKPFWDKKDYHNGFVLVGFDQVLHYIQLDMTIKWVQNLVL